VESISLTQNQHFNSYRGESEAVLARSPHMYMPMIETAEVVAQRYRVTRETQDRYALQSQQRVAAAYQAGRFDAEIVPVASRKLITDKASGATRAEEVRLARDEGFSRASHSSSRCGLAAMVSRAASSSRRATPRSSPMAPRRW